MYHNITYFMRHYLAIAGASLWTGQKSGQFKKWEISQTGCKIDAMKIFRKEKVEGKCLSSKWLNINECVAGTNLTEIINTGKTPV
jgi:hypothetical protein